MTLISLFFILLFVVSSVGILHTYFFYPVWMILFTKQKKQNDFVFQDNEMDVLPTVSILFAAYNEESVLDAKLKSMLNTTYPIDKIKIIVGSDASTDKTNEIVMQYSALHPQVQLIEFPGRTGKAGIINQLAAQSDSEIFILTDANVIFKENTIFELVKHFKNTDVAQVAANIIKVSPSKQGIASQEMNYIQMENVPTSSDEEFKRKVRISIGNFQNLMRYKALLFKRNIGFAFLSHKLLRWHTPFFLIITFVSSFFLSWFHNVFFFFFIAELFLLLSPAFSGLFGRSNSKGPIHYAAHFVKMNTALLKGFFIWLKGVESNVWQPTKRSSD